MSVPTGSSVGRKVLVELTSGKPNLDHRAEHLLYGLVECLKERRGPCSGGDVLPRRQQLDPRRDHGGAAGGGGWPARGCGAQGVVELGGAVGSAPWFRCARPDSPRKGACRDSVGLAGYSGESPFTVVRSSSADRQIGESMPGRDRDSKGQIRTRDRVRDLAEVYTHEREVNAMLDLIPDMLPPTASGGDIKFLEPACGSGNFLVEILLRKLSAIRFDRIGSASNYEFRILRALASLYGIDICPDNVDEARDRMLDVVRSHYYSDANTVEPTKGFVSAARAILGTNILCADFLAEAATPEFIDYQAVRSGYFMRVWSVLDGTVANETQPDLFHQAPEPKRDETPVHYLDLAATPDPLRTESGTLGIPRSA